MPTPHELYDAAVTLKNQGDLPGAIAKLKEVLAVDPNHADTHCALAVYLLMFQHIPVARTQALIADLTGARPSTGWISSVLTDLLLDVEKLIKSLIVLAHVIHVDETSSNINGAR